MGAGNVRQMNLIERAVEMLRIAAEVIRENAPDVTAEYDGVTCDGICIADDCESIAETLMRMCVK